MFLMYKVKYLQTETPTEGFHATVQRVLGQNSDTDSSVRTMCIKMCMSLLQ